MIKKNTRCFYFCSICSVALQKYDSDMKLTRPSKADLYGQACIDKKTPIVKDMIGFSAS